MNKREKYILLVVLGEIVKLQSQKGKAGKVDGFPELTDKELKKWIARSPDIEQFEDNTFISLSAFKIVLGWNEENLKSDTFLDVLSAVNQVYNMFPIKTFLVKDMDAETKAKLRKCGVKI